MCKNVKRDSYGQPYCRWTGLLKQQSLFTVYRFLTQENKLPFLLLFAAYKVAVFYQFHFPFAVGCGFLEFHRCCNFFGINFYFHGIPRSSEEFRGKNYTEFPKKYRNYCTLGIWRHGNMESWTWRHGGIELTLIPPAVVLYGSYCLKA